MSLFRKEALEHKKVSLHGKILVTNPLSFTFLTILSGALVSLFVTYLIVGEYTKKQRVWGVLVPDKGLIRVHSNQSGIIVKLHVDEGEQVEQGQLLYTLSSEKVINNGVGALEEIRTGLLSTDTSYIEEKERIKAIFNSVKNRNQKNLNALIYEDEQTNHQYDLVTKQIELLKTNLARYEKISESGYVSELHVDNKKQELLARQSTMLKINREKSAIAREIESIKGTINTAEFRQKNDLAELDRQRLVTRLSLLKNDAQRKIHITAPVSGTVTAIIAKPGQKTQHRRQQTNYVQNE